MTRDLEQSHVVLGHVGMSFLVILVLDNPAHVEDSSALVVSSAAHPDGHAPAIAKLALARDEAVFFDHAVGCGQDRALVYDASAADVLAIVLDRDHVREILDRGVGATQDMTGDLLLDGFWSCERNEGGFLNIGI